jgi:hypothetical protein
MLRAFAIAAEGDKVDIAKPFKGSAKLRFPEQLGNTRRILATACFVTECAFSPAIPIS